MKFLLSLIISVLPFLQALKAQAPLKQINIVNFNVKKVLPADLNAWASIPAALMMTAQKSPQERIGSAKLVLQIRGGGAVCGTGSSAARLEEVSNVRTYNTNELLGYLSSCRTLREGNYTICAQYFNVDNYPVSLEVCRDFTVEAPPANNPDYSSPDLLAPTDGSALSAQEARRPITFRWTPIVPKPKEPVTYRLRVWQLMQGQTSMGALKANSPIVDKPVENMTQTVVTNLLTGPCQPPFICDFVWTVQATNREGKPMGQNNGNSAPFNFSVKNEEVSGPLAATVKPPELIAPADKKWFHESEFGQPVVFRWTPLVPKPKEPVTYRLRVWQLMQGQTYYPPTKREKPIITKDIQNETEISISDLFTGPCRPPYLCDFIWDVQALDRQGKPIGSNEGTSPTFMFSATQYIIQLDNISVRCTGKPGVYSFSYTITNPNAGMAKLTLFTATSSTPAGAGVSSFAPPLNTNINPSGQLTITGTIAASPSLSNICLGAQIQDLANSFWQAQKDTCVKVEPCICNACDSIKIEIPDKGQISNNGNNLVLTAPVNVGPKKVKKVYADLVYFEFRAEDECVPCNKDYKTYGNFVNATLNAPGFNPGGVIPYGHEALWYAQSPAGSLINGNFQFTISMPPIVKCCPAKLNWCIRYRFEFTDCTSCEKLVCYSYSVNPSK